MPIYKKYESTHITFSPVRLKLYF